MNRREFLKSTLDTSISLSIPVSISQFYIQKSMAAVCNTQSIPKNYLIAKGTFTLITDKGEVVFPSLSFSKSDNESMDIIF